jgi:hypothetical protein
VWWLALVVPAVAWGALALSYDGPRDGLARGALVLAFVGASAALLLVDPRRRGRLAFVVLFALLLAWWLRIPPRNDRDWQPEVAVLAWADVDGDDVLLHNVRNNDYRTPTDYTEHYEDRRVSLSALRSLDLVLSYWGSPMIAHTIMSFGFADGAYVAFSIETRKEKGEEYSAVRGFFKQYELIYVVADERDVVRQRTNARGEDVYLYRLRGSPEGLRHMFLGYLRHLNRLRDHPEWYDALTHNCTTTIRGHVPPGATRSWRGWKLLLNGHLDELAYDVGALDRTLPFATLRAESRINDRARAADQAADFSRRIRAGLPGMAAASRRSVSK